jgi:hypothetical protein
MALLGVMATCTLASAALPPITAPATGEYHRGKLIWIDLMTADLAGSKKFYGELFGWEFPALGQDADGYAIAYKDGEAVAGMAAREPKPDQARQSRWIAYMSVADVPSAVKRVVEQGGQVLIAPKNLPDRGEMTILADPDGAPFGLINAAGGDPADFLPVVGDWIWALYQSPDAASAAAFYQGLGNYEVVSHGLLGQAPHYLFVADGYARASVAEIPAERSGMQPDWLYFVRVSSVADSLAQVVKLGGRILMHPKPDVLDGRLAIVVDPAGAAFGMMEWDEVDEEEQ